MRPVVVAAATVVAVAVSSAVGAVASGHVAGRHATGPDTAAPVVDAGAPADATSSRGARVGVSAADETTAGEPARTSPPTDTGAVGGSVTPGPAPPTPPSGDAGTETAVLTLVNQARATAGCAALTADPRLTAAARAHSADMARRGYFAHDTPDGVTVGARITAAGYRFSAAGENIAKGQQSASAVMRAWMNSPGHRANILNCRFRHLGIGLTRQGSTPVWTQDFGAPLG
ncbi:CAP domain-containing protein [Planosporangium thailandense]|uniref:CAP domain-containing protein n=1 Tax=Planosporangium thailandense TaxID=765197 RepID=A0ABX0Y427_9ACTN|nr:CAP domain-containing protein [Planosporangium thailandense]NJC72079.1 CAP domain-containing protein [Planosporangium thailandense]